MALLESILLLGLIAAIIDIRSITGLLNRSPERATE